MVSPMEFPIPSITAATIPDLAAGRITFRIVCHRVAPSARDACLYVSGTAAIASADMLIIWGSDMIASIIEPARMLKPNPPALSLINGTSRTSPKNPSTTEGMPTSSSIPRLIITCAQGGAISTKKTAQLIPSGTARTSEPAAM